MLKLMLANKYSNRQSTYGVLTTLACLMLSTECFASNHLILIPTRLEEFVDRYDTEVVHEHEISHFNHEDDNVWISAIEVETVEGEPETRRGLLIQLMGEHGADQIYLDSEDTLRVLYDIKKLYAAEKRIQDHGVEKSFQDHQISSNTDAVRQIGGTGSSWCFRARPVEHMVCPEVFQTIESSGFLLRTMSIDPTHVVVFFPERRLIELEAALMKGWHYLFRQRD